MTPREETEMRLTALLMGELPTEEARALEAQIAADPELAALYRRMQKATELLREAIALPEPVAPERTELSSERRAKLLAHFQTDAKAAEDAPAPIAEFPKTRDWSWVPMGLAAALVLMIGGALFVFQYQLQSPTISAMERQATDFVGTAGGIEPPAEMAAAPLMTEPANPVSSLPKLQPPLPSTATIAKSGAGTFALNSAPSTYFGPATRTAEEQAKHLLAEGQAFYDAGRYEMAKKRSQQVLNLDRGNIAARDLESQVNKSMNDYGVSAYNETRSNAIKEVDLAWQRPIRRFNIPTGAVAETDSASTPAAGSGKEEPFRGGFENRIAGAAGAPPNDASVNLGQVYIRGQAQATPTPENPVVGRAAFWDDSDTSKINIDTSGAVAMTGSGTTAAPAPVPVLKDIPILGNVFNSGSTAGTAGITVNGGGTLTLSGSNTYTGATVINGGTLSTNTTGNMSTAQPSDDFDTGVGSLSLQGRIVANNSATEAAPMQSPVPDETVVNAMKADLQKAQAEAAEAKAMVDIVIAKGKENEGKLAELQRQEMMRNRGFTGLDPAEKAKSDAATPAPAAKVIATKRAPAAKPGESSQPNAGGQVADNKRLYGAMDELYFGKSGAGVKADADASEAKAKKAEAPAEPDPNAPIAPGGMGTNPLTAGVQSGKTAISANAIDALLFGVPPGFAGASSTRRADEPAAPALSPTGPSSGDDKLMRDASGEANAKLAAPQAGKDGPNGEHITITGNTRTKDKVIRKDLGDGSEMKPNDPQAAAADNSGNQISQQAGPNLLREMAVASQKNEKIKDLLNKHGYNVQTAPSDGAAAASAPAPAASTTAAPASPAAAGAKGPATEIAKLDKELTELKQEMKALQKAEKAAPEPEPVPQRVAPPQPAAIPQPEVATSVNPFSTFSLNVSDVAFKLAAASLEKDQMPDPATVRTEEFINAFDYRDPEPAGGAPLALASEQARYPFAQNRDLLRLSVKTAAAGRQPGRALNLVLLLDNSGSMERADRVNILREALRVLCTQLQPQDKLSVVTFARTPRLWADGVSGDQAATVTARVGEITPQGGTNLEAALDLGYATAQRHAQQGSISRVVLITDGAANLGDVNPEALKRKVEDRRKQGIALDCFGIGWEGFDDSLLETLSRNGDGRYGFINSAEEAATEFAGQLAGALRVAASDVKVQVEFNPKRVTAYRQIGYAKHQLTKEQFRDNTVDAAEIGAAESGNALYLLEVNPRGEGDVAKVRVRFKVPGTTDYREHEWTVPFEGNGVPALDQASPALRLAGTASAFAEWLVSSPYATEVTPDRLLGLINGVPAKYVPDARPKKLEWMIRQAKRVSGR